MTENDILISSPDRGSTSKLFEIEADLSALLEDIANADGEMSEEQELQHKELIESFNKKGSAYGAVLNKMNNDIFSIDNEILRLQKRKTSIENQIKRINYVLIPAIKRWGTKKVTPSGIVKHILKFPLYTFEVALSTKTELVDIEEVPNNFKRYQVQLTREQFELLEAHGIENTVKKVDALKTDVIAYREGLVIKMRELEGYLGVEEDNQLSLFKEESFSNANLEKYNILKSELETLNSLIDEKQVETLKFK